MQKSLEIFRKSALSSVRCFQTSQNLFIDREWREKNKLRQNPMTESPLTYLPDFTFMDGRPTPIGQNMRRRLETQRGYARKMVDGIAELKFAKENFARKQREQESKRDEILDSKLKMKGHTLLKKNKE